MRAESWRTAAPTLTVSPLLSIRPSSASRMISISVLGLARRMLSMAISD